ADKLVWIEQGAATTIKSAPLSGSALGTATVISGACGDAVHYPGIPCAPISLTVDPQGRGVYFDSQLRVIRPIEANRTFTTIAGSTTLPADCASYCAPGKVQTAGNIALSFVEALAYDASGNLLFVDRGGTVGNPNCQDPSTCLQVQIQPWVGSIEA